MDSVFIPSLSQAQEALKLGEGPWKGPIFLTNKATIIHRLQQFYEAFDGRAYISYAMKANYNPVILRILKEAGVNGVDTGSLFEIKMAKHVGYKEDQIVFTGNNSSMEDLIAVHGEGVLLNIGSISELEKFGQMFPGEKLSIRINPGIGQGECEGIVTAGVVSKFGIHGMHLEHAREIIHKYRLNIVGLHCHIGSGFYESEIFAQAVQVLLNIAKSFSTIEFVDFGGGYGVRYWSDQKPIHLPDFYRKMKPMVEEFQKLMKRDIQIRFQPGKFLVAESTVLLLRITSIKKEFDTVFVGTNGGFNTFIRPAFYGTSHHIINLTKQNDSVRVVSKVVGNICESGDVFHENIALENPQEGDILACLTAGAYGASMSSLYNLRPYAGEVLFNETGMHCMRSVLSFEEMLKNLGFTD